MKEQEKVNNSEVLSIADKIIITIIFLVVLAILLLPFFAILYFCNIFTTDIVTIAETGTATAQILAKFCNILIWVFGCFVGLSISAALFEIIFEIITDTDDTENDKKDNNKYIKKEKTNNVHIRIHR